LGFFELASMYAEVAIGSFEDTLEVVEAERIIGCEGADDAEADALVNQAIELGEFVGERGNILTSRVEFLTNFSTALFASLRFVLAVR